MNLPQDVAGPIKNVYDTRQRKKISRTHILDNTGNVILMPNVKKFGQVKNKKINQRKKSGTGLMTVDNMVDRLHLMTQSQHAGNLSSTMQNEMMNIMDTLLKKKVINKKKHKVLYIKYIVF